MLNNDIIKKLPIFSKYNGYSIHSFERIMNTTRKNILMDIERINGVLSFYHYPLVTTKDDAIRLPKISIKDLFSKMSPTMNQYYFQEERQWMLILYLFLNNEFISNFHLQTYLRVSKNTVLSDIKNLRDALSEMNIELNYSRKEGYVLEGNSIALRHLLEKAINETLKFESGKWIVRYLFHTCQLDFGLDNIIHIFHTNSQEKALSFIEDRIETTAYLILCLLKTQRIQELDYSQVEIDSLSQANVMPLTDQFISEYPMLASEKYFIASRLLGCIQGDFYHQPDQRILEIMDQMIEVVSAKTGITFVNDEQFKINLYNHLAPAYYRLMFGMTLLNPLKEQIISEYSSLYYLVEKSMYPLSQALNKPVSEDEIAYFTMHFGGYISAHQQLNHQRKLTAATICPNGVSSSLIMTSELRNLMPEIEFKGIHQLDRMSELNSELYDLIFSTVYFETDKPLFIVQPFMNPVEKSILKQKVYNEFQIQSDYQETVDDLMRIISKYCQINDELSLKEELFRHQINKNKNNLRWEGVLLNDLLQEDLIQTKERVNNWQEAIEIAAQPLLSKGYIETSYIDAMVDSVNRLGAYIVLAPHVAVPHASPEKGVKRLGMSLLRLNEPVDFNLDSEDYDDDRQVQLVFVLAAIDSSAHLKALQQLVMILDDEETIQALIHANSVGELYQMIDDCISKGEN